MHLLSLIAENKWITMSELAQKCNVNIKTTKRDIDLLKAGKRLIRVGGRKSGYWEIIEKR
jgi:DeoR/GlpR family transcriptional regulator of sugar metabolism